MTKRNEPIPLFTNTTPRALLKELCDVVNNRPKNRSEYVTLLEYLKTKKEWEQLQRANNTHAHDTTLVPSYVNNKLLFRSARDHNVMVELVTYKHAPDQDALDMTQVLAVFDLAQKEMLVATDLPSDTKLETMPITEAALKRLFRDHNIEKTDTDLSNGKKSALSPASHS